MSSLAGRFGYPNRVAYSTTKWGLVGFTKTLSMELGPLGITANSIHPGAVDGPRIRSVFEGRAQVSGRSVDEEIGLMGLGYLAGTLGPFLGGWLYAATGGWTVPLWVYVATAVPMAIGGRMMARPGRTLEDAA
jgi:NAD(P)-dependent dehydrogenase (short-subunit alcohol dehydrogenase family)